jgi:GT2 family glycosyltransferase
MPQVSVIIITRNRPKMVRECLERLGIQTLPPDEIIVVDSSTGEDTQAVLDSYPEVVRLRIPDGRHNMPQARNLGIAHARGEILAFLDDDSMAQPEWLERLVEPYDDPSVGGVGGRLIDAMEEARATPEDPRIGVLRPDGLQRANFVRDPGRPVEVDFVRGCNMSFRRAALIHIGGFDRRYIGSNVGEETDVCLRVKKAGWKMVFQPTAVVHHLAAPREGFDREATDVEPLPLLWLAHNRSYLLFKNFGLDYRTIKHVLFGIQWAFFRSLLQKPGWVNARSAILYALGAWWGLADSLVRRLRRGARFEG